MRKLFRNFFYNAVYQLFLLLVPVITTPYLSNVVGPAKLGINSTVNFTIQFVMVFGAAAMGQIGTRTIAKAWGKKDHEELRAAFWGLWYIQFVLSAITISIFLFIMLVIKPPYWTYFLLQLPFLLGTMFDISWFFQGIADFGRVVLRNTIVKLVSVAFIFLLVKSPDDLWKYMLILSLGNLLGSSVFWFTIQKFAGRPSRGGFYHLRQSLITIGILMIPQLATQVYTSLDKTILSLFQPAAQVNFYDSSQRIANLVLSVITSITVVMMPYMAASRSDDQQRYLKKSYETTLVVGLFFMSIIMANTRQFVPWFFAESYKPMIPLMEWISLSIIFIPVGGVFANQFALAINRDKQFAIPVVVGAVLSLILNFTFDPILGAHGATMDILIVEFTVMVLRVWIVHKDYDAKDVFHDTPKYLVMGAIMVGVGFLLPDLIPSTFFNMAYKSIVMFILYAAMFALGRFELFGDIKRVATRMLRRKLS